MADNLQPTPDSQFEVGIPQGTNITPDSPSTNPLTVAPVTQQFIQQFFMQKGVPPTTAEGWARRLMMESGGNPLAVNKTSGATGLAQDLGVRKDNLFRLPNWQDPSVQLENVWNEMHGGDPIATRAFSKMMATNTTDAYNQFTHNFERPGPQGGDVLAGGTTHAGSGADLSGLQDPVQVPPLGPGDSPKIEVNLGGGATAPARPNPYQSLAILQAIMAKTHTFTPVDYDPWKYVTRPVNHNPFGSA